MAPETRYAMSGDINIAYQVIGNGPRDLILVPGWVSNIEVLWDEPIVARFLRRLASFSRLILFDKRGTGLSDRLAGLPDLETRMDDVRAVMDAGGSERAALCGYSEGGVMCMLFAATYPARTTALITIGTFARRQLAPDYPWGRTMEQQEQVLDAIRKDWGGPVGLDRFAPSLALDHRFRQWWARFLRMAASPGAAVAMSRMNFEVDVRHVLPAIHVPTLLLNTVGDLVTHVGSARLMAEGIPGAKLVELPGRDHLPFGSDVDAILDEIEEFLTGERHSSEPDRILATILFTDIVGSTDRAAALGDRRWRDLLESFYGVVRRELPRFRGLEVSTAGDGVLATFDGPARAITCAQEIALSAKPLGLDIRAGLHTGEVELRGDDITGLGVVIARRVCDLAAADELLASRTVKDLVIGSGIGFVDRGVHTLKGVPEDWQLYAVSG